MDLIDRREVVEAARLLEQEKYTGASPTVGRLKKASATEIASRIRQPIQRTPKGPTNRDKSQLLKMISIADPENGLFDPRGMSGDLGAISRNASSGFYALTSDGRPFITEEGFLAAQAELGQSAEDLIENEFRALVQVASETERAVQAQARIGQDILKRRLLATEQTCQVTGVSHPSLLRASHIRPWSHENKEARLDRRNVLLLAVHLDACFDQKLISFSEEGEVLISPQLTEKDRRLVGVHPAMRLRGHKKHQRFLTEHRTFFYGRDH